MSIHRTPEGKYRAKWRDPSGRQRSRNFVTKRDARDFLAEIQRALTSGQYVDPHSGRTCFAAHATAWLDSRNTEDTTAARDQSVMKTHVLPQWGNWPLGKIDHAAVQAWVTDLGRVRSVEVVAKCYQLTSAVLRSAVRNRLIAFNPCDGVRLPRRRKRAKDERIIDRQDVLTRLLPAAPDRYRAIIATAAGTGLRWGEAAGLCADALDLERGFLQVIRTVVEVSGRTAFKLYPKSDAGRRTIPLPDWLIPILREHTARYQPGRAGLIFPNQVGMPLRRTLFRSRVWRPTLVKAGLLGSVTELEAVTDSGDRYRAIWTTDTGDTATATFRTYAQAVKHLARHAGQALRFHDLRHSYATWLVDDEVPPNMVQRVMGHEHVSTTLQLYVRRTEHHDRIRQALNTTIVAPDDPDDDGVTGVLIPIG